MTRRSFAFWLLSSVMGVRQQMAQKSAIVGTVIACTLFVYLFARVWGLKYAAAPDEAARAAWYTFLGELGLFSFGRGQMQILQRSWPKEITYQTLRPRAALPGRLAEMWGSGFCLMVCVAIVPALYLASTLGMPPGITVSKVLLFILSAVLASVLRLLIVTIVTCTAFWLGSSDTIFWLYSQISLMAGVLMPLNFYPPILQKVAWWTPLPALAHIPNGLLLGGARVTAADITNQVAWLCGLAVLAVIVLHRGAAHYMETQN